MTNIHQIYPQELFQSLESGEVILVDVREPSEHRSESIPAAVNLPFAQVKNLRLDQDHSPTSKIVLHCQSGARSQKACDVLASMDFPSDIWNLAGGIIAWKRDGFEVETSGKRVLPLDRQVHLTIGLMILWGTTLGLSLSKFWFALPVLAGLGLVNSGLTGWCGLAKLAAKMPWNRV